MELAELALAQATHDDLSDQAGALLRHLLDGDRSHRPAPIDGLDIPNWMKGYAYELQPWPTLVGRKKLERVVRATVEIPRLLRSLFDRIFDRDAARISAYYGLREPLFTALLLEPPDGLEGTIHRCDLIDDGRDLRCVEVNSGAFLGGWQPRFWQQLHRVQPPIHEFLERQGLELRYRDPIEELFEHVITHARALGLCDSGEINLALGLSEDRPTIAETESDLDQLYKRTLKRLDLGLDGCVRLVPYPNGPSDRGRKLYFGDTRIHSLIEYTGERTPGAVYRCFKAENLALHNGPLGDLLGDKRNLALLHRYVHTFDDSDRAVIEDHVPWSSDLRPGPVRFRGEEVDLEELLRTHREGMVLKSATGAGGKDVVVGRFTTDAVWRTQVREALAESSPWLAQEYLESRPYIYQHGASGVAVHRVVWGTFCFGSRYGGGFLRMKASTGDDGIINSARGATEGLLFEI